MSSLRRSELSGTDPWHAAICESNGGQRKGSRGVLSGCLLAGLRTSRSSSDTSELRPTDCCTSPPRARAIYLLSAAGPILHHTLTLGPRSHCLFVNVPNFESLKCQRELTWSCPIV